MVAYRNGDANLYYDSWEDSSSSSYVFEVIAPLKNPEDKSVHEEASKRVAALCEAYPLY